MRLFILGGILIALHVHAQSRSVKQEVPPIPDLPHRRIPDTPTPSRVVTVDCDRGESLAEMLKGVERDTTILVTGTCHETVILFADWITIDGQEKAVIDATASKEPAITVAGGLGVTIKGLITQGGLYGILATRGAEITIERVSAEKSLSHGFTVDLKSAARILYSKTAGSGGSGLHVDGSSQVTVGSGEAAGSDGSGLPGEGAAQAMVSSAASTAAACQQTSSSQRYNCTGFCPENHHAACAISVNGASNLKILGGVTLNGGGVGSHGICLGGASSRVDSEPGSVVTINHYHNGFRVGPESTLAIKQCAHVNLNQNYYGINVLSNGTLDAADTCGLSHVNIAGSMFGIWSAGTSMFDDVTVSGNNVNLLAPTGGGFIPSGCSNFGTCGSWVGGTYCQ